MNELLRRMLFLPEQASTVARNVDYLHYFVILTTMAGATAVTVVGIVFVVQYRARGKIVPQSTAAPRMPLRLELALILGLLGLFCLWWLIGFAQYVHIRVPPGNALDVYVTGKQWMWKFAYTGGQHTVANLYVPTGRPIRLLLTSRDVIHSFFVPDFRIKHDALPGRYTVIWFEVPTPGTYQILCTEYCGVGHSTMRGQVIALLPEDYARWLEAANLQIDAPQPEQFPVDPAPNQADLDLAGPRRGEALSVEEYPPAEPLSLVRLGEQVAAQRGCLRCHTLDGSPYIGPTWAGLFHSTIPLANGERVLADVAYLTESMMDPLAKLHAPFPPVMPSYNGQLAPGEIAAILALIKSLRDVPPNESWQPADPPLPLPPPSYVAPAGEMQPPGDQPLPVPFVPGVEPEESPAPNQQGLPPPGTQDVPEPRGPVKVTPARPRPGGAP